MRHPPSSVLQLFDNRESREACEARRRGCATVRGWSSHVSMYPMVLGPFSPSHKSISVATLKPIFRGRTKQLYEKGRREGTARARVAKAKTSSELSPRQKRPRLGPNEMKARARSWIVLGHNDCETLRNGAPILALVLIKSTERLKCFVQFPFSKSGTCNS